MSWLTPLVLWLKQFIPTQPPGATIAILILSFLLSLLALTLQRLLVDVKAMRARQKELAEYDRAKLKATREKDQQTLALLKRHEIRIRQIRSQMMKDQFKTLPVLGVPFLLFFYVFSELFGNEVVAVLPVSLPFIGHEMSFFWWYFIAYSAINFPMSRIFGVLPAGRE